MFHYPKHVGDYIADTIGLSMLEDGAYNRLMDQYYISEAPLPLDRTELYRLARAVSPIERKAVDYVIAKYFNEEPDGYHQNRIDIEIEAYHIRAETAQANGRRGGRKPKQNPQETQPVSDGLADSNQDQTTTKTNRKPYSLSNDKESGKPRFDPSTIEISAFIPRASWLEWIEYRRKRKLSTTEVTARKQAIALAEWARAGHNPASIIDASITNGWQGLFEPKKGSANGNSRAEKLGAYTGRNDRREAIAGESVRVPS